MPIVRLLVSTLVLFASAGAAHAVTPSPDDSPLNRGDRPAQVRLQAEVGALAVAKHRIQFSKAGTMIDYVEEGGQDRLFPYVRLAADLDIGDRNTVVFLYQPLDLRTREIAARDLVVDGETFRKGTPMEYRYGFSFWRASWLYDVQAAPNKEVAFGIGMQLRNAVIDFGSQDGTQFRSERDIGPVPLFKFRSRHPLGKGFWFGSEVDGAYAPIKYINGSNSDVVGSLLDASLRSGLQVRPGVDAYLNLRYLTGGAEGTGNDTRPPGDGFAENYLHFIALSLGFGLR